MLQFLVPILCAWEKKRTFGTYVDICCLLGFKHMVQLKALFQVHACYIFAHMACGMHAGQRKRQKAWRRTPTHIYHIAADRQDRALWLEGWLVFPRCCCPLHGLLFGGCALPFCVCPGLVGTNHCLVLPGTRASSHAPQPSAFLYHRRVPFEHAVGSYVWRDTV